MELKCESLEALLKRWDGTVESWRYPDRFAFADSTPERKITWLEEMYKFYAEVQRMRERGEI